MDEATKKQILRPRSPMAMALVFGKWFRPSGSSLSGTVNMVMCAVGEALYPLNPDWVCAKCEDQPQLYLNSIQFDHTDGTIIESGEALICLYCGTYWNKEKYEELLADLDD